MDFEIKAYRSADGVSLIRIPASTPEEAVRLAEARGYRVIAVGNTTGLAGKAMAMRIGPRTRFSLALFSQELLGLLDAGLSLIEAVDLLGRKARDVESREVIARVHDSLIRGESLSRALEGQPERFPLLYVATVKTSERTGDLIEALRRYLEYHQQINRVRDKVMSASIYPALLLGVGLLVIFFLMSYVVPRFSGIYEDLGDDLPFLSRVLMGWGKFFNEYAVSVSFGTGALLTVLAYLLSRSSVRAGLMQWLWSIPALGEQLRLYQLARFSRTLSMLLSGGIPAVPALEMVGGLLQQAALRRGLEDATREVREGHVLSSAFERHGLATEVGVRLLLVGERSGELAQAMDRIARIYDGEIARWLDRFTKLFEPILMIFIGLLIGGIVLLMYMPIFELAGSIQ